MIRSQSRWSVWGLALLLGACQGGDVSTVVSDGSAGDGTSTSTHDGLQFGDSGQSSGACPCAAGAVCYSGSCVPDKGSCTTDDECQGDSFCHEGHCVPYGAGTKTHDPECKNSGFTPEQLQAPSLKCKWTKKGVRMSPVVADLDGDQKPEIIFITEDGYLTAIRGDTCAQLFSVQGNYTRGSNPAVGDLDGDKVPEIVCIDKTNHVVVHDAKGKKLATSPVAAKRHYSETSGGAAIANLDQKGRPEIVYAGLALRFINGGLDVLFNSPVYGGYRGIFSAVADVDLDGKPDIVAGNTILDGQTGADKTPANIKALPGGHTAIAQFDSTPEPEIVLITSHATNPGTIRIFNPKTGNVIFGPYTFGKENGGPPTVADFDGDGQPEVAAAGYVGYALFDMECAKKPLPAFCHSEGIRWLKQTQDKSSGCTGSSVFDFNGDGKAEVVYRDECWLRVYDGTTGKIRFATTVTSGTKMELPVVVDVDNDSHADIVVSADSYTNCTDEPELGLKHTGSLDGIFVFQDPKNKWMPSRAIWNQHTYHITNINDDGTVPVTEANNWLTWNNYRQNVQGMLQKEIPAPDMTGAEQPQVGIDPASDCQSSWMLRAKICNRGVEQAPAGVAGTFYLGDPRSGGTKLCTGTTQQALGPGECDVVQCEYTNPAQGTIDLWFRADDDGNDGAQVECKEQNNLLHLPEASCPGGDLS